MRILSLLITLIISINTIAFAEEAYTEDKTGVMVTSGHPEFTIKLKSNPTTGYTWFLREYNSDLIQPTKHVYEAPGNKMMGAPGYELWTFRVKHEGFTVPQQTTIRFVYSRPWEGTDQSKQVVFRVSTSATNGAQSEPHS